MSASEKSLTEELDLVPLNLELPDPVKLKLDNENFFAWSSEGYGIILSIQTGYDLWAENQEPYRKAFENRDKELQICNLINEELEETTDLLRIDRANAYMALETEQAMNEYQEKERKIKVVLWIAGAIIVGGVAGFIGGLLVK